MFACSMQIVMKHDPTHLRYCFGVSPAARLPCKIYCARSLDQIADRCIGEFFQIYSIGDIFRGQIKIKRTGIPFSNSEPVNFLKQCIKPSQLCLSENADAQAIPQGWVIYGLWGTEERFEHL